MPLFNSFCVSGSPVPGSVSLELFPPILTVDGPRLRIEVSVPNALAAQSSGTTPTPIVGIALIDTGASITCIDRDALAPLGIPPTAQIEVHTPSGTDTQMVYPVRIDFPGTLLGSVDAIPVAAARLAEQGILALIGRDLLQQCVLIYNGPAGTWTIAY